VIQAQFAPAQPMLIAGAMNELEKRIDEITYKIRRAAMIVHRRIGPGCFEAAYSPCFAYELQRQALQFLREVPIPLKYDDLVIDRAYVADYMVEGLVIAELKVSTSNTTADSVQLRTYLRLSGCPVGLLINFGVTLMKDGIIRQVDNFPYGTERGCVPPLDTSDLSI
jgi:GxxExxY protein